MAATPERGNAATLSIIRFRADVFDLLAEKAGAEGESDRAALVGIDRTTLYRIRQGQVTPTLPVAMQMAMRVGAQVEELFEVAS